MSADYQRPAEDLPPVLTVESKSAVAYLTSMYASGISIDAQRVRFDTHRPNDPDTIIFAAHYDGLNAMINLTPAMIVHLANTMLTANERTAIEQEAKS